MGTPRDEAAARRGALEEAYASAAAGWRAAFLAGEAGDLGAYVAARCRESGGSPTRMREECLRAAFSAWEELRGRGGA